MAFPDERDQLIDRAQYGEITGEEADAEALRLGLAALSRRPRPDEFRPEKLTHWTLPMALAWVAYRDLDQVREWSAPYREQCWHWLWRRWRIGTDGPIHEGWFLEQAARPSMDRVGLAIAADLAEETEPAPMAFGEASEGLWRKLRDGSLAAVGINTTTGERAEVPSLEWHDLQPVAGSNDPNEMHRGGRQYDLGYRDILLPAGAVQRLWRREERLANSLPALVAPDGMGYMPLYCAAQWIATEGGRLIFDPAETERWRPAFRDLLGAIASEAVRVVGVAERRFEPVPAHLFAGIQVDYPFTQARLELLLSEELVLRSYPYFDEEHWQKGFDDTLEDRRTEHWRRLMVQKEDVRSLWPFDYEAEQRTGLPGRPSLSKHLIAEELLRRASMGNLASTLAKEADELRQWLRAQHPRHAPPEVRTVENNIRDEYRRLKPTK